jgi:hypothetical protein
MEFIELIKAEYLAIIFGGLGGVATAFFTQKVLNKRGLFSYFVNHNRVGVSSQDSVFGNVSVTWNGKAVDHLFLSTIELNNESLEDYENVVIQTYSNDTSLHTESTQIIGTPNLLEWTESYKRKLEVPEGGEATETQLNIYRGQREHLIPVFNRGQKVRITYMNAAESTKMPTIWLSATLKGVKVKFKIPQQEILGVSRPRAAIIGALIGLLLLFPLVIFVKNSWAIALAAITYGYFVVVPGAYALKAYRKARDLIGG